MMFHKASVTEDHKFKSDKEQFKNIVSNLFPGDYLLCFLKLSDRNIREWQNYYRAVLGELSLHSGYTKPELHDMIKEAVLADMLEPGEEESTTVLDTTRWQMFFLNFASWAHNNFDFII